VYASRRGPYRRFTVPGRPNLPSAQDRLAASSKRLRTRLGWTQEKAAETAGLNIRHYQKIEEGSVNVTLKTVEQVAEAFGVDLIELLRAPPS
jgi:transcriptional regulator with XRE-family HTH domain